MKPYFGLYFFTVIIAYLGIVLLRLDSFANDPGLGWHLKAGEWILKNRELPAFDPFLVFGQTDSWIADQWLSDLLFGLLYQAGGWSLLYAVLIVYYLLLIFAYTYSRLLAISRSPLLSCLIVLVPFILTQIHFICRPVIFSFICFAVLLSSLLSLSGHSDQQNNKSKTVVIFLTALIWANLHPSFLLVFVMLAVFVFFNPRYYYLFLIALIGTVVNPYGFALHYSSIEVSLWQLQNPIFTEWRETEFTGAVAFLFASPWILILLKILLRKKFSEQEYLITCLAFIFATISILSVRFVPYYSFIAAFSLALSCRDLQIQVVKKHLPEIGQAMSNLDRKESQSFAAKVMLSLICIVVLIKSVFFQQVFLYQGAFGPSEKYFPLRALHYISADPQKEIRILSSINIASTITAFTPDQVKAYIDDRASMHKPAFYNYYDLFFQPVKIDLLIKTLQADYVLLANREKNSKLALYLRQNPKYSIVYIDHNSLLIKI